MTEYQHLNNGEMTCIRYLMDGLAAVSVFDKRASPEFLCGLVDITLNASIAAENKKRGIRVGELSSSDRKRLGLKNANVNHVIYIEDKYAFDNYSTAPNIVPELKKLKKLIVKEGHSIDDLARVAKKLLNSDSCRDNSFGEELDYAVRPYKNPESYRLILQRRQKFQSGRCMATHY